MSISFNKPLVLGTEMEAIQSVFEGGSFSGNGSYSQKCQLRLEELYSVKKSLLTTSCTAALELAALLLDISEGDEVIIPSFAFITTANAFVSKGAKVVFADSRPDHPSIDESQLEQLINPRTKAIVALHYGGVACNMEVINSIAEKHGLFVVEDNAQGIHACYKDKPLGTLGTLGALSFHETKNIHCGEGGALYVNHSDLIDRAEVLWDMGTNRKAFKEGKVTSYGWVDKGSSFYPSELNAAFLDTQLKSVQEVTDKRLDTWNRYFSRLKPLQESGNIRLPSIPSYANHNGHIFFLETNTEEDRNGLINHLYKAEISGSFHFQSLHKSAFFAPMYNGQELVNADKFSQSLVRLPLYHTINEAEVETVIVEVTKFFTR